MQRLTVCRHFASDNELFEACTSRRLELNPPPMPQEWSSVSEGRAHCRAGGCPWVAETLAHAVEFPTWTSPVDRGLGDEAAAALVMVWLDGAIGCGGEGTPSRSARER